MEEPQITRRDVIDNLCEGIVVLDRDFHVTDINHSSCNIFQVTANEIIGLPVKNFIFEWEKIIENFKGVENISKYETKIKNRSYNLRVSIIHNKDKKISGYVLFLEKISADQQAQSKSEITQKEYHAILDTLQDFYFEADIKGMITYVNHAFVKELGNSDKAEVIGKHFRFFTDRISVRDIFEKFKLIYDTKQPADPFEYFYHRKDGSPMVGEAYISPNIENGEVIGTRGFIRNITARVHAEKEIAEQKDLLDSLLQQSPIAMVINDLDNKITVVNPAFENLFGYSLEESLGKDLDDILSIPEILEEMKELTDLVKSEHVFEVGQRKRKDGLLVDVEMFAVPLFVKGEKFGFLVFYNDITDRLLTEFELEKAQSTFYAVLDTLMDPYFEADPTGVITYANLGFLNTVGYSSREAVIGTHFRRFTNRSVIRDWYRNFKVVFETKKPAPPFEVRFRRDNKEGIADAYVSPILEDGQVIGTRGIIRDITERKKAEQEVAEQKDLLDSLMQQSPIAMVINNLEKKIIAVNPSFEILFGYSQEEALGKDLDEILSTPEILKEMKEITAVGMNEAASRAGKRKKKDGTLVDVELEVAPFFVRGERFGYLAFYNDISERLQAEADLEKTQSTFYTTLDTLTDPYFEANPNGVITYANLSFVKAVGRRFRDDVIGTHFRHFSTRSSIREVYQNFKLVYDTKRPAPPFEYRFQLNKDLRIGDAYISPIIEMSEVIGTRGIIRDISERVKAEKLVREARDSAEHRAEELAAINRVSATVSRSLDLKDILQSVCYELTTIFNIRNAAIGLLNNERDGLEIIAFHSVTPDEESALGMVLPLEGNTSSKEVLETNKTIVIQDSKTDPNTSSAQELSKERGTKAIMIVPLLARGKAIGTIGMPAREIDHEFTENEIKLAETIASQIAASVENARLHTQTETALDVAERDLEIGRQIQSGFFPEFLPEIPGWEIATHFQAARQVAGDFYDIFKFRNSNFTAFIIADVCDKGVGAALFMVLFRSLLRAFSEREVETDNVQEHLLDIIVSTNKFISVTHGKSNMFATMFVGVLDPDSGTLSYVNGGHDPPIVLDKKGNVIHKLSPTGPAVGLFPYLEFSVKKIQLNKGDILFGFTDGTTDARNPSGNFFTEEKLLKTLGSPWSSAFSMLYNLNSAVQEHIGGQDQFDDITQFSLRRKMSVDDCNHTFNRKAVLENLGELRDFAEEVAINVGLSHEHAFAFKLAAEEIINNIVQYGYQDQESGIISLSFECDKKKAILTIVDDGMYFSPDNAETPDIEADWSERKVGGLGIYFVKELMDNVSYTKIDENKNMFVLEKELK